MSKLRVQAVVALTFATILVTAGLTTTVGYVEQRQYAVNPSAPSSVKCDQKALITAKVTKVKNGAPVANQAVGWSFIAKQSPRDRLSRDMSVTNRQGIASVKLILRAQGRQAHREGHGPGREDADHGALQGRAGLTRGARGRPSRATSPISRMKAA